MRTAKTLTRLADAQADIRLRWAHSHFVGFVMRRLNYVVGPTMVYVVVSVAPSVNVCGLAITIIFVLPYVFIRLTIINLLSLGTSCKQTSFVFFFFVFF